MAVTDAAYEGSWPPGSHCQPGLSATCGPAGCLSGGGELVETSGQRVGALLSVNVGMPQDVPWRGKTVHTAVWKEPVAGPRMVRRLNIDGDGQGDLAGHGGEQRAVFVYQIESYRYWREQLSRDDFTCGQFGENFT